MDKEEASRHLESLIYFAKKSKDGFDSGNPLFLLWHATLGAAFTASTFFDGLFRGYVWGGLVGASWIFTVIYMKRRDRVPEDVSHVESEINGLWLKQGLVMSFAGFSSIADPGIYAYYPLIFSLLMVSNYIFTQFVSESKELKLVMWFWSSVAVGAVLVPKPHDFLLAGFACWLTPPAMAVCKKIVNRKK